MRIGPTCSKTEIGSVDFVLSSRANSQRCVIAEKFGKLIVLSGSSFTRTLEVSDLGLFQYSCSPDLSVALVLCADSSVRVFDLTSSSSVPLVRRNNAPYSSRLPLVLPGAQYAIIAPEIPLQSLVVLCLSDLSEHLSEPVIAPSDSPAAFKSTPLRTCVLSPRHNLLLLVFSGPSGATLQLWRVDAKRPQLQRLWQTSEDAS